jgi:uncharacterized protein DUF5615/uncharacterized protein DUF433
MDTASTLFATSEFVATNQCSRGRATVLASLAAGAEPEKILEQFPTLKAKHIQAAIAFAAASAEEDLPVPQNPERAMKIKLDENPSLGLATVLKNLGHNVHTTAEEGLAGKPDADVWVEAPESKRFFVTSMSCDGLGALLSRQNTKFESCGNN